MADEFAVPEESDVAKLKDCCSALGGSWYLEVFARSHAKKIARQVSWETAMESSEIVFFSISAMTHIGMAFWCFSAGSEFLNPQ